MSGSPKLRSQARLTVDGSCGGGSWLEKLSGGGLKRGEWVGE